MFGYYTRNLSIVSAAKIISLFCCLNLLISGKTESAFRLPIASVTDKAANQIQYDRQPMPALNGEDASTWLKQRGIYQSLQSSIEANIYQMQWSDGAYRSVNSAQNLSATFTRTGMSVAAGDEQDSRFGMKLTAVGYGKHLHRLAEGEMKIEDNRIEYARKPADEKGSSLVEWYVNRADGLEQGFTI